MHPLPLDWALLALAVVLDVIANVLLKLSDGFRRRAYGVVAIGLVLGAFTALSLAVERIDLSLAYAIWGGFGIVATMATGWVLFGQRLAAAGWVGLSLVIGGMSLLKFAAS